MTQSISQNAGRSSRFEVLHGVLLRSFPYLANHRILKIFTPAKGLLSLIARNVHATKSAWANPFCIAEWVIKSSTNTDLHSLHEASLLTPLLHLRESYSVMSSAGSIAQELLRSQLPGKPAPKLYELLIACLKYIALNPPGIKEAFRLKLLHHEGLIHLGDCCGKCDQQAEALLFGESVCLRHSGQAAVVFNPAEWRLLMQLGSARRFTELQEVKIPLSFAEKMEKLFVERLQ